MKKEIEDIEYRISEEMEYLEDAWDIQNEINQLEYENKITTKEASDLMSSLLMETQYKDFDLVSVDDYDWEFLKMFNPDLRD